MNDKTTDQPIPGYFMKWVDGFAADTRQRNLPTSFLMQEVAIATYRHLHSIGDARILDRQEYSKWIRKTIEDELSDGNRESLAERLAFEFDAHVTCVYEGGEEWKSLYENLKAKAHSLPPSPFLGTVVGEANLTRQQIQSAHDAYIEYKKSVGRPVSYVELSGKNYPSVITPPSPVEADTFEQEAKADFEKWMNKEEDEFPLGSGEQFGYRLGAVAAYKYRQPEIDLLTDMAAKLNKGWQEATEKLNAAPSPVGWEISQNAVEKILLQEIEGGFTNVPKMEKLRKAARALVEYFGTPSRAGESEDEKHMYAISFAIWVAENGWLLYPDYDENEKPVFYKPSDDFDIPDEKMQADQLYDLYLSHINH